jgi:hypothetical protein
VRATRLAADCCSESKALAIDPWDRLVTAAWSAGLSPGLFKMLWYCGSSEFPTCCCCPRSWVFSELVLASC